MNGATYADGGSRSVVVRAITHRLTAFNQQIKTELHRLNRYYLALAHQLHAVFGHAIRYFL